MSENKTNAVMWVKRTPGFFVVVGLILTMVLAGASTAYATPATFTVNSTADTAPGGVCDARECTLREAINAANANNNSAETDIIAFNIPNEDEPLPHTITTAQALPIITQSVSIDGYTEPDASANTLVNSRAGTNAQIAVVLQQGTSSSNGLHIQSNNVVVKGLAIHSFSGFGINITRDASFVFNNARLEGNFIGTNAGGIEDKGNAGNGVRVNQVSNVTVGGDTPAARNLISGN